MNGRILLSLAAALACAAAPAASQAATLTTASHGLRAADNPSGSEQAFPVGALWGGGLIGTGALDDAPDQLVRVEGSEDHTQVNVFLVVNVACKDAGSAHRSLAAYNVPLTAEGAFNGSVPYHDSGPGGHEDGTISYQGATGAGGDPMKGTARVRFTITLNDGRTFDCDTGTFSWEARDPRTAPGSGLRKRKAGYYGTRSDDRQLEFRVGRAGSGIVDLYFSAGFKPDWCDNGQAQPGLGIGTAADADRNGIRIRKDRFKRSDSIDTSIFSGEGGRYKWTITGKFGKKAVTGTLQYRADVVQGGSVVAHCATPKLSWRAERG